MVATIGLTGLRPSPERVSDVTCPPYDVIKPGSALETHLRKNPDSLFHVILGDDPGMAQARLRSTGALIRDEEPAYYVYEQVYDGGSRTGVFVAAEVTSYAEQQIIRHEKTFDHKVRGRIALRNETSHSYGPVFVITQSSLSDVFDTVKQSQPLYDFESDFAGLSGLSGIKNRVWRVLEASAEGKALQSRLGEFPFYIADGHHRYHASLLNKQSHFLCYVTEEAKIQAYNRVTRGTVPFSNIKASLAVVPVDEFATPPKNSFCIYSKEGTYLLRAKDVPNDVVGRLDCSILERELYPVLGLSHEMISDETHFDYFPESRLDDMKTAVDSGKYDVAIALHPVSQEELIAVADAGLKDPNVVMPEKSTYFAPKILTGVFAYRHHSQGGSNPPQ